MAGARTQPSLLLRLRDTEDYAAWSQFVSIYTPLIFAFCRGRGLSEAEAADVTQDVLKAVAGAIPRFNYDPSRSSFRNWLFTVVRSKLNSFFATRVRQPRRAGDTTLQRFIEDEPDCGSEETWHREYQANLVLWAAEQIRSEFKDATWNAFWRTAILAEAIEQVAADLGLSVNAMYVARSRVTTRLKQVIQSVECDPGAVESVSHG